MAGMEWEVGVGGTWTERLPGSGPGTEDAPWMIISASGWLAHSCAIGVTGMAGRLSHSGNFSLLSITIYLLPWQSVVEPGLTQERQMLEYRLLFH